MGRSSNDGDKDVGLSHVALVVADMETTLAFYSRYANMRVVHERHDDDVHIVWISDRTRPFVLVLAAGAPVEHPLAGPFGHLGIGCESRVEVDRLVALVRTEGCLAREAVDSGYPVGYWAELRDPDGNMVEISYGQEVGLTVETAGD